MRHRRLLTAFFLVAIAARSAAAQDLKFNDYRSAMSAGAGLYRSGNLAASQQPFEAAVELARSDREKNDAYLPLIKVYAEAGEFDKMFAAAEHVVEHAAYPAQASLTIRSLLSYAHTKNQLDAFRKRYEDRLARQPKERTSLTMMAAYHQTASRDFGKRAEYLLRLVDLDKEQNKPPSAELMADLAFAYKLSRDYEQSGTLYERTAPLDKDLESSCYMEAAEAWQRGEQPDKALAAARKAHDLGPDKRAKLSLYRWHRTLGEVFLARKQKAEALHHFQAALEDTRIDTYKKQLAELIEQAKAL